MYEADSGLKLELHNLAEKEVGPERKVVMAGVAGSRLFRYNRRDSDLDCFVVYRDSKDTKSSILGPSKPPKRLTYSPISTTWSGSEYSMVFLEVDELIRGVIKGVPNYIQYLFCDLLFTETCDPDIEALTKIVSISKDVRTYSVAKYRGCASSYSHNSMRAYRLYVEYTYYVSHGYINFDKVNEIAELLGEIPKYTFSAVNIDVDIYDKVVDMLDTMRRLRCK